MLPLIYGIDGRPSDPHRVVLHEDTPNVPTDNECYGAVSAKLYDADETKPIGSTNVFDARRLYNLAAEAANTGKVLEVSMMGSNEWEVIDDPEAYAAEIVEKYGLKP